MKAIIVTLMFSFNWAYGNFIPPNQERIPVSKNSRKANAFEHLNEKLLDLYQKNFENRNVEVKVTYDLENEKVNAFARRVNEHSWSIHFTGGLLRHSKVNKRIYSLIFCHEIGHHLGGEPIKATNGWASAEGQSDYFATKDCIHKLFQTYPELLPKIQKIDSIVTVKCQNIYQDQVQRKICEQSAMMGREAMIFLQGLKRGRRGRRERRVNINRRDNTRVNTTNTGYPTSTQCRLDTLFEGALCRKTNNSENLVENCSAGTALYLGDRPQCWFK